MSEPIYIISLGLGIQSSWLHRHSTNGFFKHRILASGFADTEGEPQSVYRWKEALISMGKVPIVTVGSGSLSEHALLIKRSKKTGKLWMKGLIPAYLLNPDGTKGLMGRKCTEEHKILPLQKWYRSLIEREDFSRWRKIHKKALIELREWEEEVKIARREHRIPPVKPFAAFNECQDDALIVQYIGISSDEAGRAKDSKVPWIRSEWPLLEKHITRADLSNRWCKLGLNAPRSACTFCPFHSDEEWLRLKTEEPEEFEKAAKFEDQLQEGQRNQEALIGVPFLHESCKPIREAKFEFLPKHQQLSLFGQECEGMCGV